MELTLEQFAQACGAEAAVAAPYFDHALETMDRFRISETAVQIAAFCATLSVETGRLTSMEEDLYYKDAERLAKLYRRMFDTDGDKKISPEEIAFAQRYTRNPKGLSMQLYRGYHGRGGCMLTWERNYALYATKLDLPLLDNPELLLLPEYAMLVAGAYWDENRCNAVAHDMDEVTRRVNGPARLHLAERIAQRDIALSVLA